MTRDDAHGMPERRHLSIRLLTLILLVSSAVTVLLAGWQLWADYDRDIDSIEERLTILEHTTLDPLSNSIWALNEEQIHLLLSGMLNIESVVGVELDTDQGRHYFFGAIPTENVGVVRRYPLVYRGQQQDGPAYALGTLTLHTSLDAVYARLFDRTANILVGQALKTFVVSAFILLIVQHLITRHLGRVADYARQLSPRRSRPLFVWSAAAKAASHRTSSTRSKRHSTTCAKRCCPISRDEKRQKSAFKPPRRVTGNCFAAAATGCASLIPMAIFCKPIRRS